MRRWIRGFVIGACVVVCGMALIAPIVEVDVVTEDETLLAAVGAVPATEVVIDGHSIISNGILRRGHALDDPATCGRSKNGLEVEAGTTVLVEDVVVLLVDNVAMCIGRSQTATLGDVRISVGSIERAVPPDERPVHVIRFHRTTTLADRVLDDILGYLASFCGGILASWILLKITDATASQGDPAT